MSQITRTYEQFEIRWLRGSRWTGLQSAAEAQATVDFAAKRGEVGVVVRSTFDITFDASMAHIYQPGVAEVVA